MEESSCYWQILPYSFSDLSDAIEEMLKRQPPPPPLVDPISVSPGRVSRLGIDEWDSA